MKHAGPAALKELRYLLDELRKLIGENSGTKPGIVEKKPGTFYKKSSAFLHFHEDPAGMFADLKIHGQFERFQVTTRAQQTAFLQTVKKVLASSVLD